uniref:(northern house mosquito) hypothetical protein n=1 Tax=Culex pipiens TaxID=7175 RepID=A0A8D8BBS2_CULPI
MVCSQLKISMWRSYLDSGLPRSLSMSRNVRFFLDLLLDFLAADEVPAAAGLAEPVVTGLDSTLADLPLMGDAEAWVVGTSSSVGPGLLKLLAANAAASSRSRLNSLWESRSMAR